MKFSYVHLPISHGRKNEDYQPFIPYCIDVFSSKNDLKQNSFEFDKSQMLRELRELGQSLQNKELDADSREKINSKIKSKKEELDKINDKLKKIDKKSEEEKVRKNQKNELLSLLKSNLLTPEHRLELIDGIIRYLRSEDHQSLDNDARQEASVSISEGLLFEILPSRLNDYDWESVINVLPKTHLASFLNKINTDELLKLIKNNEQLAAFFKAISMLSFEKQVEIIDKLLALKLPISPLHVAVENGHEQLTTILLAKSSANVNVAYAKNGETPLMCAAKNGYFGIVKLLVEKGATIDKSNIQYSGTTPLHYAVKNGHFNIVEFLIKKGASVNQTNKSKQAALLFAARYGHSEIVRFLLDREAKVNQLDSFQVSPLLAAACYGHVDIVKQLLEKGANINQADGSGFTPLHYAAAWNRSEIVELLLKSGAHINLLNTKNQTPLILAANKSHNKTIKLLIDHGADITLQDHEGNTALTLAIKTNNFDMIQLLINKTSFFHTQQEATIAIQWAIENNQIEIVKQLLEKKVDINSVLNDGITPLMYAIKKGHLEIANLLINEGADVNYKESKYGQSSLEFATKSNSIEIVKLLLNNGAHIDSETISHRTVLMTAAENGHEELVKLLIERGANVHQKTTHGDTALMFAAEQGHIGTAKLLIEKGLDVNIENDQKDTALLRAAKSGKSEMFSWLISQGADKTAGMDASVSDLMKVAGKKGRTLEVSNFFKKLANGKMPTVAAHFNALYQASFFGQSDIVKIILEQNPSLTQLNIALELADAMNESKIKTMLQVAIWHNELNEEKTPRDLAIECLHKLVFDADENKLTKAFEIFLQLDKKTQRVLHIKNVYHPTNNERLTNLSQLDLLVNDAYQRFAENPTSEVVERLKGEALKIAAQANENHQQQGLHKLFGGRIQITKSRLNKHINAVYKTNNSARRNP